MGVQKLHPDKVERLLTIHTGQIGENLLLTPVFRALRRALPGARLVHLTSASTAPVLSGNPDLDEVMALDKSLAPLRYAAFLLGVRRRGFDVVLDYLGNPRSALIALASGAPRRLGFDYRVRRYCYTDVVKRRRDPVYIVEYNADLLKPLGVSLQDRGLTLVIPPEAVGRAARFIEGLGPGGPIVTVSPVSRRWYKRWPEARFSALADALVDRYGARIVLLWGPGEEGAADAVRGGMTRPCVKAPPTSLLEMAGIIARADLHVGNDNGPKHIAVAAGTPTVTIFGPTDPRAWGPPARPEGSEGPRHLAVKQEAGCARCVTRTCRDLRCLEMISVGDVLAAAEAALGRAGKGHGGWAAETAHQAM